ncbi:hypothetical protein BJV77DRAFT_633896 [Russula vinacea]|nr:hypothetical protein BJV77DRAFT_633896 [Russula vinacea]
MHGHVQGHVQTRTPFLLWLGARALNTFAQPNFALPIRTYLPCLGSSRATVLDQAVQAPSFSEPNLKATRLGCAVCFNRQLQPRLHSRPLVGPYYICFLVEFPRATDEQPRVLFACFTPSLFLLTTANIGADPLLLHALPVRSQSPEPYFLNMPLPTPDALYIFKHISIVLSHGMFPL